MPRWDVHYDEHNLTNNENLKSGECKRNTLQNVQVHWKNSLRVDMSLQSDTLSWFRANQTSFLLLMLRVITLLSLCVIDIVAIV
jgi:hypothetical protein